MAESPRMELGTAQIERKNARWDRVTQWLALTTAIFVLFTALLGSNVLNQNQTISDLRSDVLDLEAQLTVADATIEARERDTDELRAEVGQLRSALPANVADDDIPQLRATGTLVLTTDYGVDLNSTLPNFKQALDERVLRYHDEALEFSYGVSWVRLPGKTASYKTCAEASGWRRDTSIEASLLTSDEYCLRLNSGRFATVVVQDIQADQATLTITVWENP